MNRQGRGSTGPGRPSAAPGHRYGQPEPVRELADGRLLVAFHGDHDRRRVLDVSRLPLPGWHQSLAAAAAGRTGPGGGLRAFSAATTGWGALSRLVRFLGSLPQPPACPGRLTSGHLEAFYGHRARTTPAAALRDMSEARLLFALPALRGKVSAEVLDHVRAAPAGTSRTTDPGHRLQRRDRIARDRRETADHRLLRRGTGPAAGRAAGGRCQDPRPHPGRREPAPALPGRLAGDG